MGVTLEFEKTRTNHHALGDAARTKRAGQDEAGKRLPARQDFPMGLKLRKSGGSSATHARTAFKLVA